MAQHTSQSPGCFAHVSVGGHFGSMVESAFRVFLSMDPPLAESSEMRIVSDVCAWIGVNAVLEEASRRTGRRGAEPWRACRSPKTKCCEVERLSMKGKLRLAVGCAGWCWARQVEERVQQQYKLNMGNVLDQAVDSEIEPLPPSCCFTAFVASWARYVNDNEPTTVYQEATSCLSDALDLLVYGLEIVAHHTSLDQNWRL